MRLGVVGFILVLFLIGFVSVATPINTCVGLQNMRDDMNVGNRLRLPLSQPSIPQNGGIWIE